GRGGGGGGGGAGAGQGGVGGGVSTRQAPRGAQESGRGGGARDPRHRVSLAGPQAPLSGPRRGLLRPPARRARPAPRDPGSRTAGVSRDSRTRSLSVRAGSQGEFLSKH